MANIEDYSDEQLKQALLEYNVNVPVTPTTRKVCENKLKKMMASGDAPQKQASFSRTSSRELDFTDNQEDTPEEGVHRRTFTSAQRLSTRHHASELAEHSDSDPGEVSVRNLSKQERDLLLTRSEQDGGSSIWKYIGIAFLLIVLVSFLVFLNRNAQNIGDEI